MTIRTRSRFLQVMLLLPVTALTVTVRSPAAPTPARATGTLGVPRLTLDSLPSPTGSGSSVPNLAAGADGAVFLSWLEPVDSSVALRVARLDGARWGKPVTVRMARDFVVNWADFPSVVALPGNRLGVHWLQRTGRSGAYAVRIALSADGGRTWSAPVTPHRDSTATEHGFVAMWPEAGSAGSAGSVGAVWLDGRKYDRSGGSAPTNETMLLATTIAPDGRVGAEQSLDARTCDCCQNAAAVTTNGPIVAYRDRSPDEIRDIHVTRRVNGRWTPGRVVAADGWRISACPVNGPALAAAGRRVVLAWFAAPHDSARVRVALSNDAGATFGAPVRVDDGDPAGRVGVALLPDGDALVTWIERTGGESASVRARRVRRAGGLGPAITIAASSAARASGFPRLAVAGTGAGARAIFAWTMPGRPSTVRVASLRVAELR